MSSINIRTENNKAFILQTQNNPQYYKYATQSNNAPGAILLKRLYDAESRDLDTANTVESLIGYTTWTGTNGQPSAYGAYDMSGNVEEITEDIVRTRDSSGMPVEFFYALAGGSCTSPVSRSSKTSLANNVATASFTTLNRTIGFRIASSNNPLNYGQFVSVGDPNNIADTNGLGSISYVFEIGKTEITNSQYVQFLNAIAKTDTNGIFISNTTSNSQTLEAIQRTGSSGNYVYAVINPSLNNNRPVAAITYLSAIRFINWLCNNRPTGPQGPLTTENGAYTITTVNGVINRSARNTNNPNTGQPITYWLPNKNEWYKAAYYSGGSTPRYHEYPNRKDTVPLPIPKALEYYWKQFEGSAGPYGNFANYVAGSTPPGTRTVVGTNGGPSAFGTYDQTGQVWEWIERASNLGGEWSTGRMLRGGSYHWSIGWQGSNFVFSYRPNLTGDPNVGFRIAGDLSSGDDFIETVLVYDTNNTNDPASGRGAVNYEYKIGKYPVTSEQYNVFLQSVNRTLVLPLGFRITNVSSPSRASIKRAQAGINFYDAVRFANWLHNGRPNTGIADNSTTENGAYGVSYGAIQSISRVGSIAIVSSTNIHPNLSVGDQVYIFGTTSSPSGTTNNFNNATGITVLSIGANQFTVGAINSGATLATGGNFWAVSSVRKPGAKYWIPSENEWYKAAYYSPGYKYKGV